MFKTILGFVAALVSTLALASPSILVFGDSLSAGLGLAREQSWPALLQKRLQTAHLDYTVVNASISGETTAGGLARLPAALDKTKPAILILALGANDGLRGLPTTSMVSNLDAMVREAKRRNVLVLLCGMKLPPNYGPAYTTQFESSYTRVAKREGTAFVPFLLEPIATDPAAFQADRLHPVAEAQPKILEHVWKTLRPLL